MTLTVSIVIRRFFAGAMLSIILEQRKKPALHEQFASEVDRCGQDCWLTCPASLSMSASGRAIAYPDVSWR